MEFLKEVLYSSDEYKSLINNIGTPASKVGVFGVSLVHKAHLIYSVSKSVKKKIFVFAHDETEGTELKKNLVSMGLSVYTYFFRDFNIMSIEGCSKDYEQKRIKTLTKISDLDFDVVITCFDAALQHTIPPEVLKSLFVNLKVADASCTLKKLTSVLALSGYEKYPTVEAVGQYAARGGIVDFFPVGSENPVRVEYFGDEIDTLSYFDVQTQRRTDSVANVPIAPASEAICMNTHKLILKLRDISVSAINEKTMEMLAKDIDKLESSVQLASFDKFINLIYDHPATIFDYISDNDVIFISEPNKSYERLNAVNCQISEDIKDFLYDGTICKELGVFSEDLTYAFKSIEKNPVVFLDLFYHKNYMMPLGELLEFKAKEDGVWDGSMESLSETLELSGYKQKAVAVLTGTKKYAENVYEYLKNNGIACEVSENPERIDIGKIYMIPNTLTSGFEYIGIPFLLITHGEFNTRKKINKKRDKNAKQVYSLSELHVGDYIVHSTHGIGVFRGIHKIEMNEIKKDYIKVAYAKGDILYVPVTQLDLVSKYIGPGENAKVKVNRLGSSDWQKSKARVKAALKDLAKKLIKLYAQRQASVGYAFSKDSEWQKDFESRFEYDETEDQLTSIEEIKKDMEKSAPMDRLLCGDVGFGKTEVALRAAFKCVCDSKQCAILVPTTILSWQHYKTALKRFEGFPIRIEYLSRFKTKKEQAQIIKQLKNGEIDIIIGTHRLVQNDIVFRDLGLAIIDEEQRFGVAQKEKFKVMRQNVDILTLSATPIPRTLNMALSGIRDMSALEQAPRDRRPIQTYVLEHDDIIIDEAIKKELRRGGQVYYLHNNIDTIQRTANKIQSRIPQATVAIGHGKMSEEELSEVWEKILNKDVNVFVCTTIIETGIDIPNVNTLIIENADHMGLSQLHQLRGRIGRSSRKAYAYLTFRRNKVLSDISQKRLSAIKEFTEFGSGFKIAMRDLELRGAGNILGGEQHGNMEDVGYEMYIKLLNKAIRKEKGEEVENTEIDCLIDIQVNAHIPSSYISDLTQRLDIYKKISDIKNKEDSLEVTDELIDRFSDVPESVKGLIDISLTRNLAASLGIYEIKQKSNTLLLYQEKMDLKKLMPIISNSDRKIMVNAGNIPYISIQLNDNEKPLNVLSDILQSMEKDS